jgi:uncharacterized membrane protein YphA (DoxX/SURF4 family)
MRQGAIGGGGELAAPLLAFQPVQLDLLEDAQLDVEPGVSPPLVRVIGALELAGALGALVGLAVPLLGVAAAIGLAMLMEAAFSFHLRAGDYRDPKLRGPAFMPIILFLLAAATTVLRIVTF